MRKLLLTSAALAAFAGQAFAADLPARPVYKAPPPPPVYGWTGFYAGVNLGYSWGKLTNDFTVNAVPATFTESQQMNGIIGGFQWGYNWQFGNWVIGTESDFMFTDQRGSTNYCNAGCTIVASASHRLPWLGTGRTRLGVLATPNILLYGTGGVAYGQVKSDYSLAVLGVNAGTVSFRDTRVGWTVGAGIEGMVAPNWLLRAEYLYVDLGNEKTTYVDGAGTTQFTNNRRVNDSIARAALSYKFGGL